MKSIVYWIDILSGGRNVTDMVTYQLDGCNAFVSDV
jgi:hypothetical protein